MVVQLGTKQWGNVIKKILKPGDYNSDIRKKCVESVLKSY